MNHDTYMRNLKYDADVLIYKTEDRLVVGTGKKRWIRDGLGVWDQQTQTIMCGIDKQQCPAVQQRELYSVSEINHNRKEYLKGIYVYN